MTTTRIIVIILGILVLGYCFFNILPHYIKDSQIKKFIKRNKKFPCYHTRLDCENCVGSQDCKFKDDPNCLIVTKGDD